MNASYCVYVVRCSDGTLYTGIARDVSERLHEHNHTPRGAKYTRGRRPVVLCYQEMVWSRSEAQQREHLIKSMTRAQKEDLIAGRSSVVSTTE